MIKYDARIEVKVTQAMKDAIQEYADKRDLKIADIVREALHEYIGSHNPKEVKK